MVARQVIGKCAADRHSPVPLRQTYEQLAGCLTAFDVKEHRSPNSAITGFSTVPESSGVGEIREIPHDSPGYFPGCPNRCVCTLGAAIVGIRLDMCDDIQDV
jgi:hypothetical protein